MDLEFATTEELAIELTNRTTFVGAFIRSTTEHRTPNTVHSNFQINTNMSDEDLSTLLGHALECIKRGTYRKIIKD